MEGVRELGENEKLQNHSTKKRITTLICFEGFSMQ